MNHIIHCDAPLYGHKSNGDGTSLNCHAQAQETKGLKNNTLTWQQSNKMILIFKNMYLFLERREGREKERERNIDVREKHQSVYSHTCPNLGPGLHPRYVPDQELNRQPFALQDNAQPTESHPSGQEDPYWSNYFWWVILPSSTRMFFKFSLEASAKLSDFSSCGVQQNFTLSFLSTSESASG